MKKYLILYLIFILILFSQCSKKNPFYGFDGEDLEGPEIKVNFPLTSITQGGTFTLLGTATDKGTGNNTVLKIEYSTDGGSSWQLANGTTNWSFSINSFLLYGVVPAARTILIKGTDTNYSPNVSTISVTYNIDNSNPSAIGSINDVHDLSNKYYHKLLSDPIRYEWNQVGGESQYFINMYEYNILTSTGGNIGPGVCSGVGSLTWNAVVINYDCSTGGGIKYFQFTGKDNHLYYITVQAQTGGGSPVGSMQSSKQETNDFNKPSIGAGIALKVNNLPTGNFSSEPVISWNPAALTDIGSGVLKIYINISGPTTVNLSIPYTIDAKNYIPSGLLDGAYTATISIEDKAGNMSDPNHPIDQINFTINKTSANDLNITGIMTDNTTGNGYYNNSQHSASPLYFEWDHVSVCTGYDILLVQTDTGLSKLYSTLTPGVGGGIGLASDAVNAKVNNVKISQPVLNKIRFEFNKDDLGSNHSYQIMVKAYNEAGTKSIDWKLSKSIFIDTSIPAAGVMSSPANSSLTNVNFSWLNFADNLISKETGLDYYEAQSCDGSSGICSAADPDVSVHWSSIQNLLLKTNITTNGWDTKTFNDTETVYIRVRAVDKAGNRSGWVMSGGTYVDSQVLPVPIVNYSPGINQWTNGAISFTLTPNGCSAAKFLHYEYILIKNGNPQAMVVTADGFLNPVVNIAAPADGDMYKIIARIVDKTGKSGNWSAGVDFIGFDNQPPSTVFAVFASKPGGAAGTIDLSWGGFMDAGSGIQYYEIKTSKDNIEWSDWNSIGNVTSITTSGYNNGIGMNGLFVSGLPAYVKIRAVDNLGQPSIEKVVLSAVTVP